MPYRSARLLAALSFFAVPLAVSAQTTAPNQSGAQNGAPSPKSARPPFRLGFGDMMIMAVQPRHLKLAMAGSEKNWKLAKWIHDELQETFDRLGRLYPDVDGRQTAPMLLMVKPSMNELDQAIKAQNPKQFAVAYDHLTQACNACHMVNEVSEIVIKVPPGLNPFQDQDFTARKDQVNRRHS